MRHVAREDMTRDERKRHCRGPLWPLRCVDHRPILLAGWIHIIELHLRSSYLFLASFGLFWPIRLGAKALATDPIDTSEVHASLGWRLTKTVQWPL